MAVGATIHRFEIGLSDVDRSVYEQLSLRVAQHPSETSRFLMARVLAYCLCYEEGIRFGRGVSSSDEPAIAIVDRTGQMQAWVDIGVPAAERMHRASKATRRVVIFTHRSPALLLREVGKRAIHRVGEIEAYALDPDFLDQLAERSGRNAAWEITHTEGSLFVTVDGSALNTTPLRISLSDGG